MACSKSSSDAIVRLHQEVGLPASMAPCTVAQLALLALCGDDGQLASCFFEKPVSTRHASKVREAVFVMQGLPQEVELAVAIVQQLADGAAESALAHSRWGDDDSLLGLWKRLSSSMPQSMTPRVGDYGGVARLSVLFLTLPGYRECFQDAYTRVPAGFWTGIHTLVEQGIEWRAEDTQALLETVL